MPKKTREEKIIAQYRKKIKLIETESYRPPEKNNTKIQETVPSLQKPAVTENITEKDITLKKYFLSDFTKSLFLIGFIISLEFVFYFVRIKGY